MSAKTTSTAKLFGALSLFIFSLLVFIFLVTVYLQPSASEKTGSDEKVSPLVSSTPTQEATVTQTFSSENGWKITYPNYLMVDTSAAGESLERLTLSYLESQQPQDERLFNGYSVDFSVERKSVSLSTYADRDSLRVSDGKRTAFTVATLGNKSGYKATIDSVQDYTNYYLPLKDEEKVLIVTTSTGGDNQAEYAETVLSLLEKLELLD